MAEDLFAQQQRRKAGNSGGRTNAGNQRTSNAKAGNSGRKVRKTNHGQGTRETSQQGGGANQRITALESEISALKSQIANMPQTPSVPPELEGRLAGIEGWLNALEGKYNELEQELFNNLRIVEAEGQARRRRVALADVEDEGAGTSSRRASYVEARVAAPVPAGNHREVRVGGDPNHVVGIVYGKANWKTVGPGSITCNNATFGDPIPGVEKLCYNKDATFGKKEGEVWGTFTEPYKMPYGLLAGHHFRKNEVIKCEDSTFASHGVIRILSATGVRKACYHDGEKIADEGETFILR